MKHKTAIGSLFLFFGNAIGFSQVQSDSLFYNTRRFENLQEKYTDNDFNYIEKTKIDTSAWDRFWSAVGQFLRDLFDFGNGAKALSGIEIAMKIIAFLVIIFVIYLIVKVIINKEGGWIFGKSAKKIKVSEITEEDIHSMDFSSAITKAKNEKNLRLANRYYYLWLLKSFSDKEIIEWDIEKTNADYLNEISNLELKNEFQFLSYVYEHSWYGEFDLTKTDFERTETTFQKLIANT
jgi:ABC-type multidrug transport system fused ATPase/permease subunit